MKLSLSTNWCNRRLESGEEIAAKALELGFTELELGFHTTLFQVQGFKKMRDQIPVGSVHAFCPVPISAPQGYPELYTLASFDEDARGLARFHVKKNIAFAAEMGADTVVLHAGRVMFGGILFNRGFDSGTLRAALERAKGNRDDRRYQKLLARARKVRDARGTKLLDVFRGEIAALVPELEKCGVVLALENLPYLEGFPNEDEMSSLAREFAGAPVMAWFDTGHHRVRECCGWLADGADGKPPAAGIVRGMHLNDVTDINDDHFAPGGGKVDFAALTDMMRSVRHVVFEPHSHVSQESLAKGVELIRTIAK
jgi:sugar phosphate isomerase/epimerase